jgi:hypothetical protein
MELLYFIFESFTHFIGTVFLILLTGTVITKIVKAFRIIEINQQNLPQLPQQTVNQSVFNDLLKLWNNKGKGDSDKK